MARNTWDGWRDPDVQADPEEAQMPYSSRSSRMPSPSINSKLMFDVFGRRCTRFPLTRLLGMRFRSSFSSLSPKISYRRIFLVHVLGGQFAGLAQSDDARRVFRATPAFSFLMAADEEWRKFGSLPHVQDPDPFRGVELVTGDGKHVDAVALQADGNLPGALHGVGVKDDPPFAGQVGRHFHGEDNPRFVVGPT